MSLVSIRSSANARSYSTSGILKTTVRWLEENSRTAGKFVTSWPNNASIITFMKPKILMLLINVIISILITVACAPRRAATPDPISQVQQAVAATLAAIPSTTPYPQPTPYPTSTLMTLAGLFCEYQFCIGHPPDIAFFDVLAQRNPAAPSTYSQGFLTAFNANMVTQLLWQYAPGTADPKFLLDQVVDPEVDAITGNMDVKLVRDMNVLYTPITTTATDVLPFGGAGAWTCGDRVFAWKVYTPVENQAAPLFEEAIGRFRC